MADDTYKSLLGKASSPGSTWGEIAGAYFSKGNKKDNRARNILLASLFFNAKEAAMQSNVLKNLEDFDGRQSVELAKAQAEFNKRAKIMEAEELIKNKGADEYFDAQAEAWFNNPDNQPSNFDSRDFEDINSPMYNTKRAAKQRYIKDVLLAEHQAKYNNIDTTIETFEEYSKPLKDALKAEQRKISRPSEVSLVHKAFGKLGIGGDEKYLKDYNTAKDLLNKKQAKRGTIFSDDFNIVSYDTKNLTLEELAGTKYYKDTGYSLEFIDPNRGITDEERLLGQQYTETQFKNLPAFKDLKTPNGKNIALQIFKDSAPSARTEKDVLQYLNTAILDEAVVERENLFNSIKINDSEFKGKKPLRKEGESLTQYNAREDVKAWQNSLDKAYSPGTKKYIDARRQSGYQVSALEEYEVELDQIIDFNSDVKEQYKLLQDDKITQEEYNNFRSNKIDKLKQNWIDKKLLIPSRLQTMIDGSLEIQISELESFLNSQEGKYEIEKYQENWNRKLPNNPIDSDMAKQKVRRGRLQSIYNGYTSNLKDFGLDVPTEFEEMSLDTDVGSEELNIAISNSGLINDINLTE